jgi:hypothetical protein
MQVKLKFLERIGRMPMPIDLLVEYWWTQESFYVPLRMMSLKKKTNQGKERYYDWAWAYPTYELNIQNQNH